MSLEKAMDVYHSKIVNREGKGAIKFSITDFKRSIMEGLGEDVVRSYFRIWNPIKEERNRNSPMGRSDFNIYRDNLFDWPMIVQSKLGGCWEQYNRLVSIQSPACVLHCWHCYVEDELKVARDESMVQLTAYQILNAFFEQKQYDAEKNGLEDYVLRISGGEPLIMPELTLEILEELKARAKDKEVFVWVDTNLAPLIKERSDKAFIEKWVDLNAFSRFDNFCLYPCLHGISPTNFEWVTKVNAKYFDKIVQGLKTLIEHKIDIYPTFGSNVSPPKDVAAIFQRLIEINKNLPLRFGLIDYELFYPPVAERVVKLSGPRMIYNKVLVIDRWNRLLKEHFGVGYTEKPRWEVQLY